jgi:hypothetical protein
MLNNQRISVEKIPKHGIMIMKLMINLGKKIIAFGTST